LPVKLRVQVALLPLPLSAQLALVGETLAPLAVTVNVPVGVGLPPPCVVSLTVTVQLLACPMTTGLVQETVVELLRFTVIDAVPLLPACPVEPLPSPP
jgi:hypothetical protein